MFCPNCGTSLPEESAFCPNCGFSLMKGTVPPTQPWQPNAPQNVPPPYGYNLPVKSELLAVILGFFIPGAGHIYLGKLVRGLIFMIAYFSLSVISVWVVWNQIGGLVSTSDPNEIMNALSGSIGLIMAVSIATFIIWIVQIVDVYMLTKKYNEGLQRTGQAPW
jgi:TM2 domain-containing membrane protein YozV